MDISVVVPAYNEDARLLSTLQKLWSTLSCQFKSFEIIIVDDGSCDGTSDVVNDFSESHSEVRLIRYDHNRGKGYAVRQGMLAAKGALVLFSDADLSTPAEELKKLIRMIGQGFDIAIGSRATSDAKILQSQPLYRVLMGKTFNKIVQVLGVWGISDTQCGFKCFTRQAVTKVFPRCRIDGFSFDVEALFIARKKGLRIKEVGVLWSNSPGSKVHPVKHSMQMIRDLFVIRFYSLTGRYDRDSAVRTNIEA